MADEVEQVCPSALNYTVFPLTRREYEYSEKRAANSSPVCSFKGANVFIYPRLFCSYRGEARQTS